MELKTIVQEKLPHFSRLVNNLRPLLTIRQSETYSDADNDNSTE